MVYNVNFDSKLEFVYDVKENYYYGVSCTEHSIKNIFYWLLKRGRIDRGLFISQKLFMTSIMSLKMLRTFHSLSAFILKLLQLKFNPTF